VINKRNIDYSTWVATDDLGRTTPPNKSVGNIKKDKYVGIFYFLCLNGGNPIIDHTKMYLEMGIDDMKKRLSREMPGAGRGYWAEPYFGYYKSDDTWVFRKHAYMLDAAGIDFIFLDVSNDPTYPENHLPLFETWLQIRKEGGNTPQIAFLTGVVDGNLPNHIVELRTEGAYSKENYKKYEELFFKWEGKPLIFGEIEQIPEEMKKDIEDNFTVRGSWAWKDVDGYWNWLMEWPQAKGRDYKGNFEQVSVTMGHHPASNKGRSYVNCIQPNNGLEDFEFTTDTAQYGLCFEQQFNKAMELDPKVLMITGWNEWIAHWNAEPDGVVMANAKTNYVYVDQFNPEFSRDGEPMRIRRGNAHGFGDNFYYQMTDYIRKFKGINKEPKDYTKKTIDINGDISQWENVLPEFQDSIGDIAHRKHPAFDDSIIYINNSGRNDLDTAKVTQDNDNIYFMISTVNDIIYSNESNWMNLLIDIDMNHNTGWEGYDFIFNRSRNDGNMSVQKFVDNDWKFEDIGEVKYSVKKNILTIACPKALIGLSGNVSFDFKWADNSTDSGDIMQFMDLGDCAPNDRFNFRYLGGEIK